MKIFQSIIGLFGIYRMTIRSTETVPLSENTFTPLPKNITPVGLQLDPETGIDLSTSDNEKK